MAEPDNLVLVYLRRMDEKLDCVVERLDNLMARLGSIKKQVLGARRDLIELRADFVRLEPRMDSPDTRVSRIERRLDLAEA